ncbi:MAG: NrdH-redoxin [Candidatus Brennerbacteria bacterium RIFOXYC1_FULL_41_11]|uniref:NrdH-redoxin n=1 Tax=Candidatus Brennerbacteria bacterium RIFOXYD1_FULL_41_16 TaxID=1797529 RepID=A0A1G1XLC8_9BACT|nr:MAG: NrdH-redoxin [Candidatus Brennerbacteria bacterium RIFOXYB1_FULL_41_13]OGY39204.1 MAG: NrdH-redoxin [Candidatus Brennerbacteria bacterium RIFOXYC1_FULL_41_11]OGY40486.1 MAG: NrdH-redoxin [Candidatus Brennerbacteria bacterium RIFOXYD1_FULL_41_16]
MTVKIYSTATCAYCAMAKKFLNDNKVPFQEIRVDQDRQALQEMVQKTGQMGVPVIDVDGKVMVGFNQKVLADLVGVKID